MSRILLVPHFCVLFCVLGPSAGADLPTASVGPPSVAQARKILRRGPGSLSVGRPGEGKLVRGERMRLRGKHYAFLPRIAQRKTNYATRELAGLLRRASAAVSRDYPRSVMRIGNIGFQHGGPIPWSVSHQCGRDVDVALYTLHAQSDKPASLHTLVAFGPDGLDRTRRFRFDTGRNLALVAAMLYDTEAPVQRIYVAEWLKELLIHRARAEGRSTDLLNRMEDGLAQPWLSSPHDDHFHVRIFCPAKDRPHGCQDRGRVWPWLVAYDAEVRRRVKGLVWALRSPSMTQRLAALEALGSLRHVDAIPALRNRLLSKETRLREGALDALVRLGDKAAQPAIVAALPEAVDPAWARALLAAAAKADGQATVGLAAQIIERPADVLPASARKSGLVDLQLAAARLLAHRGTEVHAPLLLGLLDSGNAELRRMGAKALAALTGHPPPRDKARSAVYWQQLLAGIGGRGRLRWLCQSLARRGYAVGGHAPLHPSVVRELVRAAGSREELTSTTASRALQEISGWELDARGRSGRTMKRLWGVWLRLIERRFGRAAPIRRERAGLEQAPPSYLSPASPAETPRRSRQTIRRERAGPSR